MRGQKLAGVLASAVLVAAVGVVPFSAALQSAATPAPERLVRLEPKLAAELAEASSDQKLEVLVGAKTAAAAEAAIRDVGLEPFLTFDKVGFSSTAGSPDAIRKLAERPGVTYVQGNRPLKPSMETAPIATRIPEAEAAYAAGFGKSKNSQGKRAGHAKKSKDSGSGELDGSGVGIAVVDSGMAGDHEMFTDAEGKTRLLNIKQLCVNFFSCASEAGDEPDEYFLNATGLDTDVMATGGHGTHVTAIAGGKAVSASTGAELRGVARNASLYGLGAGAGIFVINAAASLNWVLEHHAAPCEPFAIPPVDVAGGCAPIKVVNNSYGSPGEYDANDFFAVISEALVAEGVTVVWAAGNGDEITSTDPRPNDGSVNLTNPPGQSPVPGVLMVANYDDGGLGTRDGLLNPSSSRGRYGRPTTYPDVAAPGTNILAACRAWLPICSSGYSDPNYGEISGTSMAAPHVAGVVALLLQANPALTPAQIEDVLEDTAYQFTAGGPYEADPRNPDHTTSFDKGHGLVDVYAALARVMGAPIEQSVAPDVEPCSASQVLLDTIGDAQAGMDLTEAHMAWDGTKLTTTLSVDGLAPTYPGGTTGRSFFVDFKVAGVPYFIVASDSLNRPFSPAIGRPEGSVRRQKTGEGMTAVLDPAAETITITLTQATIDALNKQLASEEGFKPLPALSSTTFNNITAVTYTQRGVGLSLLTEHDVADSGCGFTVGGTAFAEPPPPRHEEATDGGTGGGINPPTDGQVALSPGQEHTFEGTPAKTFVEHSCGGAMDEECFVYAVDVTAGTLSLDLYAFEAADYDLYVFDSQGNELELEGTLPTHNFVGTVGEGGTLAVTTGRYFVVVQPFLTTPNFPFELVLKLA